MDNNDLKVFINSTVNYFKNISGEEANMGVPFLLNDENILLDYTTVIGISGEKKGGIYISSSLDLLKELIFLQLGNNNPEEELLNDMVGELANTISGNAREIFGPSFMISVPIIITGAPEKIKISGTSYAVPINWKNHKAFLVVGFEK